MARSADPDLTNRQSPSGPASGADIRTVGAEWAEEICCVRILCNSLQSTLADASPLSASDAGEARRYFSDELPALLGSWRSGILPQIARNMSASMEIRAMLELIDDDLRDLNQQLQRLDAALDQLAENENSETRRAVQSGVQAYCRSQQNMLDWIERKLLPLLLPG